MKTFVSLFLIFFNFSLYASLSCDINEKQIDLSLKGGPLHPLRITNQDGLGICHIEQLHKLLKAAMPSHPDFSRMDLAINEKAVRDNKVASNKKKAVRWYQSENDPGGTYIDAGGACEAYNLIKSRKVCPYGLDQFEKLTKKNAYDQEKILETLAMYFDNEKKEASDNPFQEGTITRGIGKALDYCPLNTEIVTKFLSIHPPPFIKTNAKGYTKIKLYEYLQSSNMEEYIRKIYPHITVLTPKDSSYIEFLNELNRAEKCATNQFSNPLVVDGDIASCRAILSPAIFSLAHFGFNLKDLYRFSKAASKDRDDYFLQAFACDGAKEEIPENLTCQSINTFSEAMKLKDVNKHTMAFAAHVDKALKQKLPLGISVCTRFFKHPEVTTINFETGKYDCGDKTSPGYQAGEGSHAVTIIGKRCRTGKVEYLVQNSWGAGCGYYNKAYSCTGKGGFWVPAEILAMNSRALNILKP